MAFNNNGNGKHVQKPQTTQVAVINKDHLVQRWEMQKEQAQIAYESGLLQKSLNNIKKCWALVLKGNELGFPVMYALEVLYVINDKIVLKNEAGLALVYEKYPDAKVPEVVTPLENRHRECTIRWARPGGKEQEFRYDEEDAKKAGLLNKKNWVNHPEDMYRWRAIARALKILFPDAMKATMLEAELNHGEVIETTATQVPKKIEEKAAEGPLPLGGEEDIKQAGEETAKIDSQKPTVESLTKTIREIQKNLKPNLQAHVDTRLVEYGDDLAKLSTLRETLSGLVGGNA